MVLHHILEFLLQCAEDLLVGGNNSALMAVATGEVLRGDDSHTVIRSMTEDEFGVIVRQKAAIDSLHDERPQTQGLVRRLVIEQQLHIFDLSRATQPVESPDKLLGDREGCLADGCLAFYLSEAPIHHIRHL